jgi:signal transduction histidine kinase
MAKFEGFIVLALVGGWMLLLPSARPPLKLSPRLWPVLAFCFLAALPFVCLRVQIPVLHYESGWAGYALHNPGSTLSNWPGLFMILFARLFVSSDFANWSGEGGRLHWIGKWDGLSSLYNHPTLGLAWLCLFMAVALWFAVPARRQVVVWTLAMLIGALAAFSGVFASFVNITNLDQVIGYTADKIAGRYLFPVLLAWFATMMTLFFADPHQPTTADRSRPALKHGYWLAVGALLIMALGVFVLPKNESSLPENPLQNAATTNFPNGSETNSPENPDLQTRMELANQLDKAGKFVEAIQELREAARLYPNDPMALNNLAWSLAANSRQELRNGREAVQLASKAVELTGQQQPVFMGTLAAAYAEDGQFAKAVEMANQARDIALSKQQPDVAAINEQLIKLYFAGKAVGLTNGP